MNREIKFRAWDNQRNAWARNEVTESIGLTFGTTDYFINIAGEKMARWSFMQYTGLKDKNGKEIYEGDVLRWKSSNPFSLGEIKTVKVWYSRARFWCNGSIGIYLDELLVNEKCEVIGNIYENPELLGKEATV